MSFGEFLVQKTKENYLAIHLMTSYPDTLDSEKVDQDGIFYYKDILHFLFE
jgi:hypothetical protein